MKIGVVGAGTMGCGIAQVFAATQGYTVVLCDVKKEFAERGCQKIAATFDKLVQKGKLSQELADKSVASIEAAELQDLRDCDLIVEAVLEDPVMKAKLFADLNAICKPETVFASNTSSLSITELGTKGGRPVVGMHFFNPVPVMKLVEVVAGIHTKHEDIELVKRVAEDIGKTPIEVNEQASFVVNRILITMINEAVGVLADGVATAENIDLAMRLGANHPMGPLALGDLIGLDVVLAIMEVQFSETGDTKYRPHPLLRKMVRGGLLGRKTGRGFFVYDQK
ncbi:MAG: 3-hydroxybutyryl-CoA dehydrogenase [Clostridia bacterium]|nr:3-hydroxybutyryl-CoA dehydrogenase [Clostridia bacterium]